MVERITMDEGNNLGYGAKDGVLLGRRWGYDILDEGKPHKTLRTLWYLIGPAQSGYGIGMVRWKLTVESLLS